MFCVVAENYVTFICGARSENNGDSEQFNGREAETATLFETSSVTFYVVAGGFRPRHLSRWAVSRFGGKVEI